MTLQSAGPKLIPINLTIGTAKTFPTEYNKNNAYIFNTCYLRIDLYLPDHVSPHIIGN